MGAGVHGGFGETRGAKENYYGMSEYRDQLTMDFSFGFSRANDFTKNKSIEEKGTSLSDTFGQSRSVVSRKKNSPFKKNDKVRTLVNRERYPAGTVGLVVRVHLLDQTCDVSLIDEHDCPLDVITFLFGELELI